MASPVSEEQLDSLSSLEERVTRAVEVVTRLREEKQALESQLGTALAERDAARKETANEAAHAQKLAQELDDLRSERKQVRTRIEKLLGQMDLLSGS
jgi:FtsZ-binding cell division protein ZapB